MPNSPSFRPFPPHLTVLWIFCLTLFVLSRGDGQEIGAPDSLLRLTTDSTKSVSLRRWFLPAIGNLGKPLDTTSSLHSRQFVFTDAIYLGDILATLPGTYIPDLGEAGGPVDITAQGIDARGIAFRIDGRPLNDPVYGGYNLYDIPLEYLNEIESFQGPDAIADFPNSVGGAFNIVSHQYNTVRPFTKIRFFQGPFNHILSDGIFAQDISRVTSIMAGFQRHASDGRFPNSAYDAWNFRGRVRFNLSEQFNGWISEFYTKSTIGLNGGVNPETSSSIFDEITAHVNDPRTYQISSRHDLTAGATLRLLSDSSALSNIRVYYSSISREYAIGGPAGAPPEFSDIQNSSFRGASISQRLSIPIASIDVRAEWEQRHVDRDLFLDARTETYTAIAGQAALEASPWLSGSFSLRLEHLRQTSALSWGASLKSEMNGWLRLVGEYSKSYRQPTIQELYWQDSTLIRTSDLSREAHTLAELGLHIQSEMLGLSLTGFNRRIGNALIFSQIPGTGTINLSSQPTMDITGGSVGIRITAWHLGLSGNVSYLDYDHQKSTAQTYPRLTFVSEFSYRNQLVNNNLDLKIALRLRGVSHHAGLLYLPKLQVYARQDIAEMPAFTALDAYAVAGIGSATIMLSWENPLDVQAMLVPYYPLLSRSIKLGINWTFLD